MGISTYALKAKDLVIERVTPHGPICTVQIEPRALERERIMSSVFLNK